MTISAHTLIMSVRAVDAKSRELESLIDESGDSDVSYLEEDLLSYSKAEIELKKMYMDMQKESDNLPTYEDLVG